MVNKLTTVVEEQSKKIQLLESQEKYTKEVTSNELNYGGCSRIPVKRNNIPRFKPVEKKLKLESELEFPSIIPETTSYVEKLKLRGKQEFNYKVKEYINNFRVIANYLNTKPILQINKSENLEEGYCTENFKGINELVALPKCNQNLIKTAFDYGLLHVIYTTDAEELRMLPALYKMAKNYIRITKAQLIFIRCYSAYAEVDYEKIRQPIKVVKMGITRQFILPGEVQVQKELSFEEVPDKLRMGRLYNMKSMIKVLKDTLETNVWVTINQENLLAMSNGRDQGNGSIEQIMEWMETLLCPSNPPKTKAIKQGYLSEEAMKIFCKLTYQEKYHHCKYCNEDNYQEVPTINKDFGESSGQQGATEDNFEIKKKEESGPSVVHQQNKEKASVKM